MTTATDSSSDASLADARRGLNEPQTELFTEWLDGYWCEHRAMKLTSGGQIIAIDRDLASSAPFSPAEIVRRAAGTLPRWADVHFQEIEREIAVLAALRERYRELSYRATNDAIAQFEFDETEKVHNQEVFAGWYSIQSEVADFEQQSQRAWAAAAESASKSIEAAITSDIIDWDQEDADRFASYKATAAYLGHFSIYQKGHHENTPNKSDLDYVWTRGDLVEGPIDAPQIVAPEVAQQEINTFPMPKKLWAMLNRSILPETMFSLASINSQRTLAAGASTSAELMAKAKDRLAEWNLADVQFRRARTQISIDMNAMRTASKAAPSGALNLIAQLSQLRDEFCDRMSDMMVRFSACREGFTNVWGYANFPAVPDPVSWDENKGSFFDTVLSCHREFRRCLAQWATKEINSVVSISLRKIMGETAFREVLDQASASGSETAHLQFQFPETLASPLSYARLRGLIGYVVGASDHAAGPWQATVRPPTHAVGPTGPIDQDAQVVDLSRVHTREFPRPPDTVGLASLRNIVPVTATGSTDPGALWSVSLKMQSLRGIDASSLADIELDLLLAGQAQ